MNEEKSLEESLEDTKEVLENRSKFLKFKSKVDSHQTEALVYFVQTFALIGLVYFNLLWLLIGWLLGTALCHFACSLHYNRKFNKLTQEFWYQNLDKTSGR